MRLSLTPDVSVLLRHESFRLVGWWQAPQQRLHQYEFDQDGPFQGGLIDWITISVARRRRCGELGNLSLSGPAVCHSPGRIVGVVNKEAFVSPLVILGG